MLQVIQKLMVVSNPTRIFEVGTEIEGRDVIEIKQVGYEQDGGGLFSEFHVLDENGYLISSVENCPVIVDWKTIAEHGEVEKCFYCEEQPATEVKFGKPCCFGCESQEISSSARVYAMSDNQKANHVKMGLQAFKLAFAENEK